jgi:hypothetical protein
MKKLLALALPLALASCTMTLPGSPYTLGKQPAAGDLTPTGTVMGRTYGTELTTEARVMGLKPNQYYVAHYHLQGTASPNPCESGGAPILSTTIVGQTDATGMLTMIGRVPYADAMKATYFNIHTAADAAGTPADAGVACTAVQMPMTGM